MCYHAPDTHSLGNYRIPGYRQGQGGLCQFVEAPVPDRSTNVIVDISNVAIWVGTIAQPGRPVRRASPPWSAEQGK